MKYTLGSLATLAVITLLLAACVSGAPESPAEETPPTPQPDPEEDRVLEPEIDQFISHATFPVALAFAPDGRLFYTEKAGSVWVVEDGIPQPMPVITLPTDSFVERGMLGIAIDPDFENNRHIWVYHTATSDETEGEPENRVVRFTERDGVGSDPEVALAVPIPPENAGVHNGGNLHFGPDGMLYVSIGDYFVDGYSQNLDVMPGKIHRFIPSVPLGIPDDNPFPGSSIYAYGMRNPFDFTFDPYTGDMLATDNGPECNDEVNVVVAGGNYGWREDYDCETEDLLAEDYPFEAPIRFFPRSQGMSGIVVYQGDEFPEWDGSVLFCAWEDGELRLGTFNEQRDRMATDLIDLGRALCQIDIAVGPDGLVYFTSAGTIYVARHP